MCPACQNLLSKLHHLSPPQDHAQQRAPSCLACCLELCACAGARGCTMCRQPCTSSCRSFKWMPAHAACLEHAILLGAREESFNMLHNFEMMCLGMPSYYPAWLEKVCMGRASTLTQIGAIACICYCKGTLRIGAAARTRANMLQQKAFDRTVKQTL